MNEEISEKIRLQKEYCRKEKTPYFAPETGVCWSCRRQIYHAFDEEYVSNHLITGCPYCHRSYVD